MLAGQRGVLGHRATRERPGRLSVVWACVNDARAVVTDQARKETRGASNLRVDVKIPFAPWEAFSILRAPLRDRSSPLPTLSVSAPLRDAPPVVPDRTLTPETRDESIEPQWLRHAHAACQHAAHRVRDAPHHRRGPAT